MKGKGGSNYEGKNLGDIITDLMILGPYNCLMGPTLWSNPSRHRRAEECVKRGPLGKKQFSARREL